MRQVLQPTDTELKIVHANSVAKAAELTGRSRETIRRWRTEHNAATPSFRGRPRRKLPDALIVHLGTKPDAELSRMFGVPKNTIRNYRLEHGIPAHGEDFYNSGSAYLLVTSVLALDASDAFDVDFPLGDFDLTAERLPPASDTDAPPEAIDAEAVLWGLQAGPYIPRASDGRSLLDHLRRHLAPATGAAVAIVAPGQSLEEAAALAVSSEGEIRVGTYGLLIERADDIAMRRAPAKLLRRMPVKLHGD